MSQSLKSSKSLEFAVFPLPEMVAFPGQIVSLHIFEPRYRKMIHDCVQSRRPLGLALPKKALSHKREKEFSAAEMLQRNQLTFEPFSIMGVGPIQLNETTADGRLYIEVNIQCVAHVQQLVQDVPYYLAEGTILEEKPVAPETAAKWIEKLEAAYQSVLEKDPKFNARLRETVASEKLSFSDWTYLIFRWCKMDPGFMQMVLEVRDPLLRAQILAEVLAPITEEAKDEKGTVLPFPDPL